MKVNVECSSCQATGLYCGFAEPKGVAVVCLNCGGTGCVEQIFKPFTKRKDKPGIRIVRFSRGPFIFTGVGATGDSVSYEDFRRGKMPKKS